MIGGDLDQYIMRQGQMVAPTPTLSVSDIERLAKAGVKLDLGTVFPVADPAVEAPHQAYPSSLEDAFWQRWKRSHPHQPYMPAPNPPPYLIHAHDYGDTVYVMVCPSNSAPFIIEDESPLYPSDALMAKLALYERTKP